MPASAARCAVFNVQTDGGSWRLGSTEFCVRGYDARMIFRVCLSALLGLVACAATAEEPRAPLTAEQLREAEFLDGFSVPAPGEIFSALGKSGKPDWAAFYRKQPAAAYTSRPLIALNLGTRLADCFLAVAAQDRQQVKNISTEVKVLAKSLGLEIGRAHV